MYRQAHLQKTAAEKSSLESKIRHLQDELAAAASSRDAASLVHGEELSALRSEMRSEIGRHEDALSLAVLARDKAEGERREVIRVMEESAGEIRRARGLAEAMRMAEAQIHTHARLVSGDAPSLPPSWHQSIHPYIHMSVRIESNLWSSHLSLSLSRASHPTCVSPPAHPVINRRSGK